MVSLKVHLHSIIMVYIKGYYIEFDAKETRSKTSFPINNIHKHQIEYIRKVIKT